MPPPPPQCKKEFTTQKNSTMNSDKIRATMKHFCENYISPLNYMNGDILGLKVKPGDALPIFVLTLLNTKIGNITTYDFRIEILRPKDANCNILDLKHSGEIDIAKDECFLRHLLAYLKNKHACSNIVTDAAIDKIDFYANFQSTSSDFAHLNNHYLCVVPLLRVEVATPLAQEFEFKFFLNE